MPQINKPTDYFNTVTYTGNGSTQSITGAGFQPDWVWIKDRTDAFKHALFDVARGATKSLTSNDTNAEATETGGLTSFDSDGFSIGSWGTVNTSSSNFVSWNWLGGGTASSNTDGSITSSVSANTTSGFSIVSYTGTGSAGATVGHGLGVTPKFILTKNREDGTSSWGGYHVGIDATSPENYVIQLDGNGARIATSNGWNNTAPTSSVVTLGSGSYTNGSSQGIIMYCFAEKKGFSKISSYVGNGSSDGTFIYTGFKPAFVIAKRTDSTGSWWIFDNKRNPYNDPALFLNANTSDAEVGLTSVFDSCSNGFKMRNTYTDLNASGGTYIYMAFAENPLVGTNNIPATAR